MDPKYTDIPDTQTKSTDQGKEIKRKIPGHKTKEIIRKIPQQKTHLEFVSALLTIPVLITVLLLNLNNLQGKKAASQITPTSTPAKTKNSGTIPVTLIETSATPAPTTNPQQCIKGIGTISVSYPQEGQTVSDSPLCITIDYSGGNYCSVVWAYKINNSSLSDYGNNSVCLYNVPQGNNTFTLQVKSLVSSDTQEVDRHFIYKSTNPTPSPSLIPTTSASSSAAAQ